MTRPSGKSPARSKTKRSQLDLEPISLIDVRGEDESLLPGRGKATPQRSAGYASRPHLVAASPFKARGAKTLASIQEDQPECEETPLSNEAKKQDMLSPLATQEPAVTKKKKKTGFNLRKSLAWNNAFFTEEGVLDPEELSFVNRTFKKPPEEPKPVSHKKPVLAPKLVKASVMPKINFSPIRAQKSVMHVDSQKNGSALCSPLRSTGNIRGSATERAELHNNNIKGFAGSRHGSGIPMSRVQDDPNKQNKPMFSIRTEFHGPNPSPLKKYIEGNLRNITGHPLPAHSSPKPLLQQPRSIQSLSSTISSASKKMKDRLGMVFSGRTGNLKGSTRSMSEDDSVVPSHSVPYPDYSESAKLTRCYSHSSYERFGRLAFATSMESVTSNVGMSSAPTAMESSSSNLPGRMDEKGSLLTTCGGFSSNGGSVETNISLHHGKEQAPPALSSQSQGLPISSRPLQQNASVEINPTTKETSGSESLLSRAKPSGLRMPSPKLGFFDKARAVNAPQIAVLQERTNGFGCDGVALQSGGNVGASRLPSESGGMSSTSKQSNGYRAALQSMRTTSRLLTESGSVNTYSKKTFGVKPRVSSAKSSYLHSEAIGRSRGSDVPSESFLRPASLLTEGSSSGVKPRVSSAKSSYLHSEATGRSRGSDVPTESFLRPASLTEGSSSMTHGLSSMTHGLSSKSSMTHGSYSIMHGSSTITHGSSSNSSQNKADTTVGNTGPVLQVKKNVQNVFPAGKNLVTQLTSSPSRNVSGQDKLLLERPAVKKLVTQLTSSPSRNVSGQENLLLESQQDKGGFSRSPELMEKICSNEEFEEAYLHSEATGRSRGSDVPTERFLRPASLTEGSSSMTHGPSSMTHGSSSMTHGLSSKSSMTHGSYSIMHGSSSMTHGPSSNSSHNKADTMVGNTGPVLQVKKNVQNVLPAGKNLVTQLTSSPSRNVSGQENLLLERPAVKKVVTQLTSSPSRNVSDQESLLLESQQDKGGFSRSPELMEKICSNEEFEEACVTETTEEWPQVKTGAVKHSPPNKEPPKHGPWSPVRRNGQELGPFDCTKYTNTGIPH